MNVRLIIPVIMLAVVVGCTTTTNTKVGAQKSTSKYTCPGPSDVKEGKVSLLIDVDDQGKAVNIRVAESEPKGIFDETAICIAKQATFKKSKDGKLPPFKDHIADYEFKIPSPG